MISNLPSKIKKAQQVVEFALVAPILLTLILIIIEFGFALNAKVTLSEAIKIGVSKANEISLLSGTNDFKKNKLKTEVQTYIKDYLKDHGVLHSDSVFVDLVELKNSGQIAIIAGYAYKPMFTLPFSDSFFKDTYNFLSLQLVSLNTVTENTATTPISTDNLNSLWKSDFNPDGLKGLLTDYNIANIDITQVKQSIAFLVGFDNVNEKARLFNWWGEDLLPPSLYLNVQDGYLYAKSPYYNLSYFNTKIPFTWILSSLGFTQAIYTKPSPAPSLKDYKLELRSNNNSLNSDIKWCDQLFPSRGTCDNSNFSLDTINNQLKKTISMLFNKTDSFGGIEYAPSGNFEAIEDRNNRLNGNVIKPYLVSTSNYLLKLFLPTDTFNPSPSSLFQFQFYISPSGKYQGTSPQNTNIVDVYMDNDNDNIPNAWDKHPEYFDMNNNNIIDGKETVLIDSTDFDNKLPDSMIESTDFMTSLTTGNIIGDVLHTTSTTIFGLIHHFNPICPGEHYVIDNITSIPLDLTGSSPFQPSGTLKTLPSLGQGYTYIPTRSDLSNSYSKISMTYKKVNIMCAPIETNAVEAVYVKSNENYYRKFHNWSSNNERVYFINGYISGSEIELDTSNELKQLQDTSFGFFRNSNKVSR